MQPRPLRTGIQGIMQVTPPTVDRERLARTLEGLAGMREGLARVGEAAQQAFPGLRFRVGIDPATRAMVGYTDRTTGITFTSDGEIPGFTSELVDRNMQALREAYRAHISELYGLPPGFFDQPEPEPAADLDANEELIRSTRAEFPYDPWDYGDLEPDGPMHWSPPEGEDVPPCP